VERRLRILVLAATIAAIHGAVLFAQGAGGTVNVQLLAINDFHGALEPASGANGRIGSTDVGGVEYLSAHLERLRRSNPNTITVSAGDNIGATPLLSSLSHDEATIEALNLAGLQLSAVGNHELDEGWWELQRMQEGGCHPVDGCIASSPFKGAAFDFLAANVTLDPRAADPAEVTRRNVAGTEVRPLFPPFAVRETGGVRIGFIGVTLRDAPAIIVPQAVRGLRFGDEAVAANAAAKELRAQGVRAIVVLMHQGGEQRGGNINGCDRMSRDLNDLVSRMSDDIDVVISGHTHQSYNCTIDGKLVTSAASSGRLLTDIDLRVRRSNGEVVGKAARNVLVTRDVARDPAQTALIARYSPIAEKVGGRVIGRLAGSLTRATDDNGESVMGRFIADALLDAARRAGAGDVDVAFWNTGGLRADLPAAGTDTPVTYAQLFSVLPFGNELIVKTMTGSALLRLLNEQFDPGRTRVLPVSSTLRYTYDSARPQGQRVQASDVLISGAPLNPARRYRVATSNFLWAGGDGVGALSTATEPVTIGVDVDLVAAYVSRQPSIQPDPESRVRAAR
jgi:5'-nucleotidase